MLEWLSFIADCLLFIGDVLQLSIHVVFAVAELISSFFNFISSLISVLSLYTNLIPFMAFGLSIFALYVVKAIFAR